MLYNVSLTQRVKLCRHADVARSQGVGNLHDACRMTVFCMNSLHESACMNNRINCITDKVAATSQKRESHWQFRRWSTIKNTDES
jgi:hypothetical protein